MENAELIAQLSARVDGLEAQVIAGRLVTEMILMYPSAELVALLGALPERAKGFALAYELTDAQIEQLRSLLEQIHLSAQASCEMNVNGL